MGNYELQCTDPYHYHFRPHAYRWQGTLKEITNKLIEFNHHYGCADLDWDFWAYVFWQAPEAYDDGFLADDEIPCKPEYTSDVVIRIAATIWGEDVERVTLRPELVSA
ncbi:hypothetical protein [Corynebacterium auriscanis]|uniref:hypothetical protein n=1 Tax=Corynebacterium auriscanis TaxID=99807 RepID=UPI003CF173BD